MSIRGNLSKIIRLFEKKFETLNVIEVSQSAILKNYDHFQSKLPNVEVWPVLKSNAYGHGLGQTAGILKARDFAYFVVDSYYEALKIWDLANRDVLLIGYTRPENFRNIDFKKLAITVYDLESIKALARTKQNIRIHLNVDTGMNRLGIDIDKLPTFIREIKKYSNLNLEGIYSHVPNQIKEFTQLSIKTKYRHLANTDGVKLLQKTDHQTNAMRLGIGLYQSALRFKSQLIKINNLEPGDKVSYGGTYTAKRNMRAGVIPVGYYEGLDRKLSNKGFVKYKDEYLPIIGRVCMNLSVIDLKKTDAKVGSEIEVIDPNPNDKNSVQSIANLCETIDYEILVNLAESTRRIIVP